MSVPVDFQGAIIGGINKRNGVIQASDMSDAMMAPTPASKPMYRSRTCSATVHRYVRRPRARASLPCMEYKTHEAVARDVQEDLVKKYEKARLEKKDDE